MGPEQVSGPGGFTDGGWADLLPPGAELAGLLVAVTGRSRNSGSRNGGSSGGTGHGRDGDTGRDGVVLRRLADQEILGVLAAGARMAAWAAWVQTVALAEFARRRPEIMAGSRKAREAAEEAGWKTAETWTRMLEQLTRAVTLTQRLPRTLAALGQGQISDYKARIIEAQTAELPDAGAAEADALLSAAAPEKNPAALRDYARRQVMRIDPAAVARRKERAQQDAHVRLWQEESGNAALSARQMPAADAVIAWQHIERRALDLHANGADGTAGQLKVQAMLDFLLGRATPGHDTHHGAGTGAHQDTHSGTDQGTRRDTRGGADKGAYSDTHGGTDQGACSDTHGGTDQGACSDTHGGADEGACGNARTGARGAAAGDRAGAGNRRGRGGGRGGWVVNPVLLVPWDPGLGRPSGPAELTGFGLLDEHDTMDLLAAAGDNPATRWCLTTTDPRDGTATAHGCISGRRALTAITPPGTAVDLAARLRVRLTPITTGACQHAHAEPGYTPSRRLRHLISARNTRCTAPACRRPATACDLDHTTPWENGGLTCECNLAPLCRAHHHIKQARGWKLEQPAPGTLTWTSPSGLSRTTTPSTAGGSGSRP